MNQPFAKTQVVDKTRLNFREAELFARCSLLFRSSYVMKV